MKAQEQNLEFDFKKIISDPIKKIERQSYKKIMFLAVGLSVFTTLGISVKQTISHHYALSDAIEARKTALSLNDIKNMSNSDFEGMLAHMMKNSNVYDEKVHFIQTIIAKSEIEDYEHSLSTGRASSLGENLDKYKENVLNDISKLSVIRRNVMNSLPISSEDADLFFKYQTAYKTKSIVRSKDLEDNMQELLYNGNRGNNRYNNKYNIYETIKTYDQKINNTFNVVDTPKPKM